MKAQERLRRLTQQLKMTDRYIKKNKKFGCKKIKTRYYVIYIVSYNKILNN